MRFPGDEFERIKKGQKGGDVIHTVRSSSGLVCGRIKWESKHTQNWIPAWLPKLREDQRAHKCDLAALMTETLPGDVTHFDVIDEVWVSGIATVLPMAAALRRGLIETATARRAAAGADSKKDIVYTLPHRDPSSAPGCAASSSRWSRCGSSLDAEKRTASRQFAVREKQLERVGLNVTGMYGDLQGLVGPSLPTVEGLALPEPEAERAGGSAAARHGGMATRRRRGALTMIPLGTVADVSTGYPFRKKVEPEAGGDIVLVQLKDMDGAEGVSGSGTITLRNDGGKYQRYLLQAGDLLFQSRGSRHPVAVVEAGIRGIAATGLHTIRPHRWAGAAGISRLVAESPCFARYVDQQSGARAVHPVRVESRPAGVPRAGAVARGARAHRRGRSTAPAGTGAARAARYSHPTTGGRRDVCGRRSNTLKEERP